MLRTLVVTAIAAGLAVSPASADKGGKGKGKGKDKDRDAVVVVKEKDAEKGRREVVVFADRDRDAVRSYWVETYGRGNCPPGLAKKNKLCLPPGQYQKRYVIGRPLPSTVVVQPVPPVLVRRLGPVPTGYEYVIVDGDIVKLAVGTRLVADAIQAIID